MPLPDNYNPSEHLQSVLRKVHNPIVRKAFSDVEDVDDFNIPRSSLKHACLIHDNDTSDMIVLRMLLFWFDMNQISELMPLNVLGVPKADYDMSVKYKPVVTLFFRQDLNAVNDDYPPIEGEISFRLIGEKWDTLANTELVQLANKIKLDFGMGGGYIWKKGKNKYWYRDPEKGINTSILALNESEAIEFLQKVCDVMDIIYDSDNLTESKTNRNSVNVTTNQIILGKSYKKPRWRPTGQVRFRRAILNVHGLPKPICLIDLSGYALNPIVSF